MLFKRGSTISAAEGGCQAEVGGECSTRCNFFFVAGDNDMTDLVACSMASAGFAACMGGESPFGELPVPDTSVQRRPKRCYRYFHSTFLRCHRLYRDLGRRDWYR
jgi:hypothetical protein